MSAAQRFITAVLKKREVSEWASFGPIKHLFKNTETDYWAFVDSHVRKHGVLPDPSTFEKHTGVELMEAVEPPSYYHEILTGRHIELGLKEATAEANGFLKPDNKKPREALRVMADHVSRLTVAQNAKAITDFAQSGPLIMDDLKTKMTGGDDLGIRLGWPYLDQMTCGLNIGDKVSLVGRPALGKTYSLLFNGLKAWGDQKKTVLFISMEIIPLLIMQRLVAMWTHIPIDAFKHAQMATSDYNDLKNGLLTISTANTSFWVIDGNLTATVDDIELLARWFKPDLILIDGAYMLGHLHERDLYRRVAMNANAIKQKICRIAPTVASYQFARKANEKKTDDDVTLDDIGYSDVIGQVSSIVLGLFEDESVETAKRRRYRVLKGRSGETGEFSTRWDFNHMDFEQVDNNSNQLQRD